MGLVILAYLIGFGFHLIFIHTFMLYAFRLILNFFYYYTLSLLNYFLSILIECNLGLSLGHDRLMINCTSHILSMYHDLILGLVE